MEIFLDREYFSKYLTVKMIYLEINHTMKLEEIADYFSYSIEKTEALMQEMIQECKDLKCEDKIQLVESQLTTSKSYTVILSDNFSIAFLQLMYLKKSFCFNVIQDLLLEDQLSIHQIEEKYGFSQEETIEKLEKVKKVLAFSNIELVIDENLKLVGEEVTIRLFYIHFFQRAYYGFEWPFSTIDFGEFKKIAKELPQSIYESNDLKGIVILYYAMAVSVQRAKGNHKINPDKLDTPLYEEENQDYDASVRKVSLFLQEYLPELSYKEIVYEIRFIYTLVITHRTHGINQKIPNFFYTNTVLQERDFMKDTMYVMTIIEKHFFEKVDIRLYYFVMFQICVINYNTMFFNDALKSLPLNWIFEDYDFVATSDYYGKVKKILEEEIQFEETQLLVAHQEYIINHYAQIIVRYIQRTRYKPEINLLLVTNPLEYQSIKDYILSSQYLNPFTINWKERGDENIDIVISDVPASQQWLGLSEEIPIYYIEQEFYSEQIGSILNKLSLIAGDRISL